MAHPPTTRYLVLAWHRGEGVPRVFGQLHDTFDGACDAALDAHDDARARGLGEDFTVHEVCMVDAAQAA